VKIWGTARVIEDDRELVASLTPSGYDAKAERAFVIEVAAWDANCPQHIPQRLEASDVARALKERDDRIAALEAELQAVRVDERRS
jgi:predicted pyridoxine 5'-phosphate oxidase superfamily flavin-nucleotide-binding protein